ncbi:sure-like protein [Roridomyces roridus]|uniref:Sure-like protein n=1 Tax=Roridomyces roridus TaxID=1738132 RepID=A0AAD7FB91_9AGAR|nr:sure-like protein [Roridomyces roridus]
MLFSAFLVLVLPLTLAQNIVLSNDDGWAVAHIRATNDALTSAGFDVVLSAPAENQSGTGSETSTPGVLTSECEFDTCPVGSPAQGFNATAPSLNYVNGFPADAAKYGIQTLAPQFFGTAPDLVVSGPNVGSKCYHLQLPDIVRSRISGNLGLAVLLSGTVGAAVEATTLNIPALAISGTTGTQVSYTTLTTDPTSANSAAALVYGALTARLVSALTSSSGPLLPANTVLNVNYPATSATTCSDASDFTFVLSRIIPNPFVDDVELCGSSHLPTESTVVGTSGGCFVSVSVMEASTKFDAGETVQAAVVQTLGSFLGCLPS